MGRDSFRARFEAPRPWRAISDGERHVANHKQAVKRHQQSLKRRQRNRHYKKMLATYLKRADADHETPEAKAEAVREALSTIARVASKGIIPKRRASRKVARLMKANKSE